ncbi:sigma-54-dependent transcriptional regulator [Hoeflea prorocentri]|uniref:Sigma-54 dependent transcriptional regulator n=1 Tax=Hoeflea prorocentri TaxID=1922333 RepID=A0A9X3ZHZ0_9HYPH|nr:sigma-54 dependent transcriptional regulator [Hoeflea prorocentri]MCY6381225.1 sigma-54 dependent transcriptional regulator [Hoeflea prorocentri]MDA5399025.1 sigma-54 dependent transcriptional regulator [Hoeflea prorocentri]
MRSRVFVIDDDRAMRESLSHLLGRAGFDVSVFFRGADAVSGLSRELPDAVVTDMKMPGLSGMDLLDHIREAQPDVPVILISAHADIPQAVEAMGKGAFSFLEKPFDPARLIRVLNHAVEKRRLLRDNRNLRARLADVSGLDRVLLGETDVMKTLREQILDLAAARMPVLLLGETGTGKDVVAHALHDLGERAGAAFVAVNCAVVTSGDFNRAMFGGDAEEPGYFTLADGGTLFLDEVDALSAGHQSALLRVLETGEFVSTGSNAVRKVDVRVISASSNDLQEKVDGGQMRPDLLYRLNAATIGLPPLVRRKDDIGLLFSHFLQLFARTYEVEAPDLSAGDIAALLSHDWPGNVRELRNVAERRVLAARRGAGSVSDAIAPSADVADLPDTLREAVAAFERRLIGKALVAHEGRMDAVAEALGIGRRTLNEKMVKLNLDRSDFVG